MVKSLISKFDIKKIKKNYKNGNPFDHVILDNFWDRKFAKKLEKEITNFDKNKSYNLTIYNNEIQKKITCTRNKNVTCW